MAVIFSSYHNSIANFLDKTEEENEDSVSVNTLGDRYAKYVLCDGAGGAGVFSGEWARFLVNAVPDKPLGFGEGSKNWFFETSRDFHDIVISKKNLSDLVLNKKVYKDGSFSTFCSCWLDITGNKLYYTAIGDTYLFIFQNNGEMFIPKEIFPINDQQEIDQNPQLLNWSIQLHADLPLKEFVLESEFVILIASDSLAKWILLNMFLSDSVAMAGLGINQNYLNSLANVSVLSRKEAIAIGSGVKSFNKLLLFLKEIASDKSKFLSVLKDLNSSSEIDIDDYSLIYIEGHVS